MCATFHACGHTGHLQPPHRENTPYRPLSLSSPSAEDPVRHIRLLRPMQPRINPAAAFEPRPSLHFSPSSILARARSCPPACGEPLGSVRFTFQAARGFRQWPFRNACVFPHSSRQVVRRLRSRAMRQVVARDARIGTRAKRERRVSFDASRKRSAHRSCTRHRLSAAQSAWRVGVPAASVPVLASHGLRFRSASTRAVAWK